ncbi:MAG: mechanosensitive ion channel family protein, partial [Flavobacteriales bacterium]
MFKEMVLGYAPKVLGAVLVIIIGFWLANFLAKRIEKSLKKSNIE